MKTAYLTEKGKIVVRDFNAPVPGPQEVMIRVRAAGICGSDIHAFQGTHPFRQPPMTLGHEVAGEVVSIGEKVQSVKVGDRVTVEPQEFCGVCYACEKGLYNLCIHRKTPGIGEWLGTFAEFFKATEKQVYVLPDSLDYDLGSLAEPLAVGVHAIRIANLSQGFTAAILGTGPIGLLAAIAAEEAGASKIFCTDINQYRLSVARDLGYEVIQANEVDVVGNIMNQTGNGCDVAIVTVSSPSIIQQAISCVRRGGKVIIISVFGEKPVPVDVSQIQLKEIEIKGSMVYTPDDTIESLDILIKRAKEMKKIVTHHVGLEQVEEAFHLLHEPQNKAIKIVVCP